MYEKHEGVPKRKGLIEEYILSTILGSTTGPHIIQGILGGCQNYGPLSGSLKKHGT